jgi:hypothetical protein
MNTEALAREALAFIKERYGLPQRGFLAGGALANTMWNLHTGKPGPINDIDVFVFESKIELQGIDHRIEKDKSLFGFKDKDRRYFEDYTGICWTDYVKDLYTISSSESEGIFNTIKYDSSTEDPAIVLKAFDLNCVKIGYHIDTDTVISSKDFEEFLETGEIKITNLMTPSHTPMRIAKKAKELGATYGELEMRLATHAIRFAFSDIIKLRFKERYVKMYEDHRDQLEKYFSLKRDEDTEKWLKMNDIETTLHKLEPTGHFFPEHSDSIEDFLDEFTHDYNLFDDANTIGINTSRELLFYIRNVWKTDKAESWKKLYFFYKDSAYLDEKISKEDEELLYRIAMYSPNSIDKLSGMSAAEQAATVRKLVEAYREDPIVAISILEKGSFKGADIEDELTRLLLELGVRKEIVNDTKGKVAKILDGEGTLP